MHGSAKHETGPALHAGCGAAFASTWHPHGDSWQYEDHVRQSSSFAHSGTAGGPGALDAMLGGVGVGNVSRGGAPLHPSSRRASRATEAAIENLRSGVEGDRTPDLIHAMDALSQLSYDPGNRNEEGVYFASPRLSSRTVRAA